MLSQNQLETITKVFNTSGDVLKAWLFGSYARNEENESSDIDILFEPDRSTHFSLLSLVGLAQSLEESLNVKVDLIVNGTLKDYITPKVNKEKILIYERSQK